MSEDDSMFRRSPHNLTSFYETHPKLCAAFIEALEAGVHHNIFSGQMRALVPDGLRQLKATRDNVLNASWYVFGIQDEWTGSMFENEEGYFVYQLIEGKMTPRLGLIPDGPYPGVPIYEKTLSFLRENEVSRIFTTNPQHGYCGLQPIHTYSSGFKRTTSILDQESQKRFTEDGLEVIVC